MPKIEQQTPTTKAASKPGPKPVAMPQTKYAPDDIFSTLRPVSEAKDTRISLLLYGRNRIGKTTLACKFPKPLLLLSCEPTGTGGAKSVSKEPGVMWKVCKTSEQIAQIAERLQQPHDFQTVVIDSVTSWEKIVLQEIRGDAKPLEMLRFGKVSQDEYTLRSEKMRDGIAPFLELPSHLVILANEKDHSKQEGQNRKSAVITIMQENSFFSADTGGGLARWLQDSCDQVCQMFMDKEYRRIETDCNGVKDFHMEETGRLIRRLRLKYHPNYAAGPRSSSGDVEWSKGQELPEFVDGETSRDLYNNLMKAITQ